jgi:flagellar motor switch protein FliM
MDSTENTPGPETAAPPAAYEECAPGALPAAQMAMVRAIQEKCVTAFAEDLGSRLDTQLTAALGPAQSLSANAFADAVETGGCLMGLDAEPIRGQALIAFSAGLVGRMLGSLLGAPPDSNLQARPLTEIEQHILGEIFGSLVEQLSAAWQAAGIRFKWTSTGVGDVIVAPGSMLVFECQLSFAEFQESLRIAVPAFLARLAAIHSAPAAAEQPPGPGREMIFNSLRRAHVTVEAVLSGSSLGMQDLLAMETGHVLVLGQAAGAPVDCLIGGKLKFRGECLAQSNRRALLLL